jgi:hypothetical protein
MGQIYERKWVAGKILETKGLRGGIDFKRETAGNDWGHSDFSYWGILLLLNIS